jgi:uncharacterized integral membrane protein
MKKALIASVIILIVLLIFSLSNPESIPVKFFRHEVSILPTILVLIAVFFGVIVGVTITLPVVLSKNEKIEKLRQQLKDISGHLRDEVEKTEGEKADKEKNE